MKAVVDRNEFAEALRKAGRALSMKTVGTLNGYCISFRSDGKSYITGTSAICRVRALFEADVETEFEIVVAQEVCEIASRLAGADIAIDCCKHKILPPYIEMFFYELNMKNLKKQNLQARPPFQAFTASGIAQPYLSWLYRQRNVLL